MGAAHPLCFMYKTLKALKRRCGRTHRLFLRKERFRMEYLQVYYSCFLTVIQEILLISCPVRGIYRNTYM